MSHLDHLISRYLDGELNSGELRELRRQLDESPEARALLREMTAVTRSARQIPSLDTPPPGLEARLFHRLHAEGLNQGLRPVARASAAASRPARSRMLGRPAAAALLLLLFSLTTSYWLSDRGEPAVTTVAEAPAPGTMAPRATTPAPEARPSLPQDRAQSAPLLSSDETPLSTRRSTVRSGVGTMNGRSIERGVRSRGMDDRAATPMLQSDPVDVRSQKNVSTPSAPMQDQPLEKNPLQTPELEQSNPIALADPNNDALAHSKMPELLPDPFSTIPAIDRIPAPATTGGAGMLAASFRPAGVSYVDGKPSRAELSLRLDARVGRDHQVSFIVGRSPIRAEQSATALIASSPASVTDEYSGPDKATTRSINAEQTTKIELENETWGGIAYSYTALETGPFQFAGGVKAGAGDKSLRVGLEGTARLSLSNVVSIEFVPTVTHVIPHRQSTSTMMVEDMSTGTLSFGESTHSTFTSVGAEVGIRIALR